jgi:hypothetical protein
MWRDAGRQPKFFALDAWFAVIWLAALLPISLWKIAVAVVLTVLGGLLAYYKMSMSAGLRFVRSWLLRRVRYAIPRHSRRRLM